MARMRSGRGIGGTRSGGKAGRGGGAVLAAGLSRFQSVVPQRRAASLGS
jgi:hypothetical protein